jgi:hypothetical protein
MTTTTIRSRSTAALIGAVAIAAVLAACSAGAPSATPVSAPGSPAPVDPAPIRPAPATPTPASPAPSDDPSAEPAPLRVDLASTSGQDVTIDILDRTDSLLGAASGKPGDGVSAGSRSVRVENVDARTLRLTWSDFPIDNELHLFVDPVDAGYRFLLIQPEPTGPADAMGEDRILELTFDRDISAAQVEAHIQEGLDTPG